MTRRLIFAPRARDDLFVLQRWLTQAGAGQTARHTLAAVRAAIKRLQHSPCLYPAGQHMGVREVPCAGGYRVFYDIHPDTGHDDTAGDVRILRVFGPGQSRQTL